MKTLILACIVTLNVIRVASGADEPAKPQATGSLDGLLYISTTNGFSLKLEPKTIADSGAIGLDYEVGFERPFAADRGIAGSRFGLEALSRGFIATEREESQNSIISELKFTGKLFLADTNQLPPLQQKRVGELLNDMDDPFRVSPAIEREYNELMASKGRRFAIFDGHIKHEADQSFDNYQIAAGFGFASDADIITGSKWAARLFDLPFALTRSSDTRDWYEPRSPRFYVGYDYVDASQNDVRTATSGDDNLNRFTAQAAWSTLAFDLVELRASFQAYYEADANRAIRSSGKEWTSFFELTAGIPIEAKKRKKIFLKYANGELPPTLEESSNVSIGFSMDLGKFD